MATAKFDIKTEATRPLYAGVGVTDRAVEAVRGSLALGTKRINDAQQDVRELDLDTVTREAKARRARVEARITELQKSVQSVPSRIQARIQAELSERELTYGQLVDRGETLVERIRRQDSTQQAKRNAKTTSSKAKATRTQSKKAASTTRSQAKGAATSTSNTAKSRAASTAERTRFSETGTFVRSPCANRLTRSSSSSQPTSATAAGSGPGGTSATSAAYASSQRSTTSRPAWSRTGWVVSVVARCCAAWR